MFGESPRRSSSHGCRAALMRRMAWHRSRAFCAVCGVAIHRRFSAIKFSTGGRDISVCRVPLLARKQCRNCSPDCFCEAVAHVSQSEIPLRLIRHGPQFVLDRPKSSAVAPGRSMGRCSVADTTRNRGAASPKNRSISRSVTQSYFAPPMPWMKRSPRANLAQSVVIEGSRTDSHAGALQLHELLDRAAGVAFRLKWQPGFPRLPIGEERFAGAALMNNRRRRGFWAVQTQNGASTTVPLRSNRGGMKAAPHAMQLPVFTQQIVVSIAEFRQRDQQVRDEPLERLAAAQPNSAEPPTFPNPKTPSN